MKTYLIAIMMALSFNVISQTIKKDKSELYFQHLVIEKGDKFLFTPNNTTPRSEIASYDESLDRFLKIYFSKLNNNVQAAWLRHPMMIRPYTEYVFRYRTLVKQSPQNLPILEFAVFDDSRETQVESYFFPIKGGVGWQQGEVKFKTANQARFARIRIEAKNSNTPGEIYFNSMELEQLSEPLAYKPELINIISVKNYNLQDNKEIMSESRALPTRKYYSISANLSWKDFFGNCQLVFEWFDASSKTVGKEICRISKMKGLLPEWNGIEIGWTKHDQTNMGWISRQKDKYFNEEERNGNVTYKTYKPLNAKFLKVYKLNNFNGDLMLKSLTVDAEY